MTDKPAAGGAVATIAPGSQPIAKAAAGVRAEGTSGTATVKVWRPDANGQLCFPELDDPEFAVPELAEKDRVAVCISGGGFRATVLALGWLRGLYHLGLLKRAQYLSVISGASWLGSALCFEKKSDDDVRTFLGPFLPPEECTLSALARVGEEGRAYAKAVGDAAPVRLFLRGAAIAAVGHIHAMVCKALGALGSGTIGLAALGISALGTALKNNTVKDAKAFKDFSPYAILGILGFLGVSIKERHKEITAADHKEVARHWTTAMAKSFLEPFGLGETDMSTVRVPGTKVAEKVADRAAKMGRGGRIYDANVKDLPFLIIGQAVMRPGTDSENYPFEWTPLYGGCPALYDNISPKLGAGWVEALGLNAELVSSKAADASSDNAVGLVADSSSAAPVAATGTEAPPVAGNDSTAAVKAAAARGGGSVMVEVRPMGPASLGEATGISSGYISMMMKDKIANMPELYRRALGIHTAKYFDQQDWETRDVLMTDGGAYDLYGIFPALRRQLPNIMVFDCNGTSLVKNLTAFSSDKDLPGLFGCSGDPGYDRTHQVFRPEKFKELFQALKDRVKAGEAPIHVATYEVQENKFLGIKGGWTTRVMWVINERMSRWEEQLPKETQAKLPRRAGWRRALEAWAPKPKAKGQFDRADLQDFPLVDTKLMKYTPELVSLLSNHAAWMLVSNAEAVREMFTR